MEGSPGVNGRARIALRSAHVAARRRTRGEVGGPYRRGARTARRAGRAACAAARTLRGVGGAAQQHVRPPPDSRGVRLGPHRRDRFPLQRRDPRPAHRDQLSGQRPVRPRGAAVSRRGVGRARRDHPPCTSGRFGRGLPGDTGVARVPAHDQPRGPEGARARRGAGQGAARGACRRRTPLGDEPLQAFTANTHTARATLLADLAEVRARGYSVDREETVVGIAGFGFALRYDAPAADAISCSVPVSRLTAEHERRIVAVMREIRSKIESAVPFRG